MIHEYLCAFLYVLSYIIIKARVGQKMTCEEMIYSNDYADIIIGYIKNYVGYEDIFEKGCVNLITQDIAVLHLRRGSQTLYNLESVPYSAIPKLYGLMDSSNIETVGAKRVQSPSGLGLRGEGVIVGIIDTGIDYENPLFRNADGSTRIGVIWDQTMQGKMGENGQAESFEEEMPDILKPIYRIRDHYADVLKESQHPYISSFYECTLLVSQTHAALHFQLW